MSNKLRVFEAFAGYGSQSISLRDIGVNHEIVGISEIEPDAIIAYGSIRYNLNDLHTNKTHDEMREELIKKNIGKDFKTGKSKIPKMKKDKLEMLYKFNKAINNFGDVSIINPSDLPDFDYFTYSFPCTDISVSGKQEGIVKGGTRSGLLYECEKIIEVKKPKYLLMENVKNLVGKKFVKQFDEWCEYLKGLGYTNYHNNYKCLNAKNFGIAQNRERIFMVSILGEHNEYIFPQGEKLTKRLKDFLEESVNEKYYLSEEIQKRFKQTKKDNVVVINEKETFEYKPSGENVIGVMGGDLWRKRHEQTRRVYDVDTVSPTVPTCSGGGQHPKILEHNTICEQRTDEGLKFFKDNICGTIRTINSGGDKRVIETEPSFRIRKLTPKECLRLMGLSDEDIYKMKSVGLSDSALYKLAGNSIVKQVLDALHRNMFQASYDSTPSSDK